MFSVKGWNVSADNLKTETSTPSTSSKKRKRTGTENNITASHFGGLWEKVIERKESKDQENAPEPKQDKKRQRVANGSGSTKEVSQDGKLGNKSKKSKRAKGEKKHAPPAKVGSKSSAQGEGLQVDDEWGGIEDEPTPRPKAESAKQEKKRKDKFSQADPNSQSGKRDQKKEKKTVSSTEMAKPTPPPPSTVKLTPLQASMREKLVSARFRHLNETLYTRPSDEAFHLFQESPEMFTEYHEGFRRQVAVWPENPVAGYIADIQARAKQRFPPKTRTADSVIPLPRTHGMCTVADLGCGDAALATALQKTQRKLGVEVKSFDLQEGGSPLITRADIANLPLKSGSVDVAVFCLALMGTNWVDFIEEAYRVLRWKGELWVAEIKSRFSQPGKKKVVEHSVGNRKKPMAAKKGKKGEAGADEARNETDLIVEVDGADDRRQETDVSAFIEVLQKRGFVLGGELNEAVDLNNKMFVKMRFIKGAPATTGKNVDHSRLAMAAAAQGKPKKKFITDTDDGDNGPADESLVLKPCVYKIR